MFTKLKGGLLETENYILVSLIFVNLSDEILDSSPFQREKDSRLFKGGRWVLTPGGA